MTPCSPPRSPPKAEIIVSGDRDLIDLGAFRHIRILTATAALTVLGR